MPNLHTSRQKVLTHFLLEIDIYSDFIIEMDNYLHIADLCQGVDYFKSVICSAFEWNDTYYGFDLWDCVDTKWKEHLISIKWSES